MAEVKTVSGEKQEIIDIRDRKMGAEPGTHELVDRILKKDAELKKARKKEEE